MKIQREINKFEKVDPRDKFHYQNYYALLACILNPKLSPGSAISMVMGECEKGLSATRRELAK